MNQSKHIDAVIASISIKTFYENGFIAALNRGLNSLLQVPKSHLSKRHIAGQSAKEQRVNVDTLIKV